MKLSPASTRAVSDPLPPMTVSPAALSLGR
jgi:hypothetical protein